MPIKRTAGKEKEESVDLTLRAVREMMRMFRAERYIYLGSAAAAVALLVYATIRVIQSPAFSLEQVGLLLGSGGLFAVSGARIIFLLNRTYDLTEDLLRHVIGLGPRRAP